MVPSELSDGGPGTFEIFDFTFPGLRRGGKRGPEGGPRRVRKGLKFVCSKSSLKKNVERSFVFYTIFMLWGVSETAVFPMVWFRLSTFVVNK